MNLLEYIFLRDNKEKMYLPENADDEVAAIDLDLYNIRSVYAGARCLLDVSNCWLPGSY